MKLRAKICHAAMTDILKGDKNKEHRVLESIILTCTGHRESECTHCENHPDREKYLAPLWLAHSEPCEFEYGINDFRKAPPQIMEKELGKYGVPYEPGMGRGITFILGDRIR